MGLNGQKGLYFDQQNTWLKEEIKSGADLSINGELFDVPLLTTDQGVAGIAGGVTAKLTLADANNDAQIYLSDLDLDQNLTNVSVGLGNLGSYLSLAVQFQTQASSDVVISILHNLPAGIVNNVINDVVPAQYIGTVDSILGSPAIAPLSNINNGLTMVGGAIVNNVGKPLVNALEQISGSTGNAIEMLPIIPL